jgi:hypothetical protein
MKKRELNLWPYTKKTVCFLLLLVMVFTYISPLAYGMSDEQRRVINSGVKYFDVQQPTTLENSSCILAGSNNEEKIWNYLITKGLSAAQAAGVMGNLQAESSFIPTNQEHVRGYSGKRASWEAEVGGWGIAQWTGGRRKDPAPVGVKNVVIDTLGNEYYTMDDLPPKENDELLSIQLDFMYNESVGRSVRPQSHPHIVQPFGAENEWEGLKMMSTVDDATYYWEWNYERPGAPHTQRRLGFAREIYNKYSSGGAEGTSNCVGSGDWTWPHGSPNGRLTSCFGSRRAPTAGASTNHRGIDIAAGSGTPILAAANGEVTFSGTSGSAGLMLRINHGDGTETQYLHNSRVHVGAGDQVTAGQHIADEGETGNVTGAHLHFEILRNGERVNPLMEIRVPDGVSIVGSNCNTSNTGGQL